MILNGRKICWSQRDRTAWKLQHDSSILSRSTLEEGS
jgi:hypothetical protein